MRILTVRIAMIVTIILVSAIVSFAQSSQQTPPDGAVVQGRIVRPEGTPPPPGNNFIFISSEMGFGGKVVKGAPYSAEAITESIQTLSDGNRIINKISSMLYRDSEGRTRREQTLKTFGPFASSGEPAQMIFINDPVAGVSYALDTAKRVAHRNSPLKLEKKMVGDVDPKIQQKFEYKIELKRTAPNTVPPVIPEGPMSLPGEQFTLRTELGPTGYVLKTVDDKRAVQESLGRQMIEGVEAEGTRTTLTIPAGEIGNELDIKVVSERWYSPELKVVVMSKQSDPRTGETIYRLTNINRAEPAKSLFELPAGFTVSEGFLFGHGPVTVPRKVRPPE